MSRRRITDEPFDRARVESLWKRQVEHNANTAAFCAAEGLDVRTYNRWKGQLMALRSTESPAPLVDVTALLTPADPGLEVILPDGIRIRLTPTFDPATLRRVVEALR
jgi:hypothetical protein